MAGEDQFAAARLPISTAWVRIVGGNHSQFAYYGFQLLDHRATLSREQQQAQIETALLGALNRPAPPPPAAGGGR